MGIICGVDGCKAGWFVVFKDLDSGCISWRVCSTPQEIIDCSPIPQIIAIDIPIGLTERGPRVCDREARSLLGWPRRTSVFPAPIRPVLKADSREDASNIWFKVEEKKVSCQTWAIVSKILEVDKVLHQNPRPQERFREVHPEVCFYYLAGKRPMKNNKKKKTGREERRTLLEGIFGRELQATLEGRSKRTFAEDDVLDAFVALWTAEGIVLGESQTIPPEPPKDSFGLSMEIVYREQPQQ